MNNVQLKKTWNTFIFLFVIMSFYKSQNKKEQIEILKHRIDSIYTILDIERINFLKEKNILKIDNQNFISNNETLKHDIQNLNIETENLLIKNKQLLKEVDLYISEIKKQKNEINNLKDSLKFKNNFQILSFGYQDENSRFLETIFVILQITENNLKGFVRRTSQAESSYFISGQLLNGTYLGGMFYIGLCDDNCLSDVNKFQLKIENLKLKLSSDGHFFIDEIPLYNGKHYFVENQTNLLIEPKIGTKEVMTNIGNNDKIDVKIIEIGNYEKINGAYDLWYKVKINDVTGWVFGGLNGLFETTDN